jgi:hypothetical protein
MSKYAPAVGDTGVIGTVDFIQRPPFGCTVGIFNANVTANGYASVQQEKLDPQLRFVCDRIPAGLNNGDAVTVDIVQNEWEVVYATNMQAY